MQVTSLSLKNFRSFAEINTIALAQVNVLVGENNSGKSSVLRALHLMQQGASSPFPDVRVTPRHQREALATIVIGLTDVYPEWGQNRAPKHSALDISVRTSDRLSGGTTQTLRFENTGHAVTPLRNAEPDHFVIPYYSKRKTVGYSENVAEGNALAVADNLSNLAAKLARISNPQFPAYTAYAEACHRILGFVVSAVSSSGGQRPGIYLQDLQALYIDQMGEGVPNIVGLLIELALAEGKLFLIEEPENDLHPNALKALLDLILLSAERNQFVVSTHSSIVVRYLGGAKDAALFNVTA